MRIQKYGLKLQMAGNPRARHSNQSQLNMNLSLPIQPSKRHEGHVAFVNGKPVMTSTSIATPQAARNGRTVTNSALNTLDTYPQSFKSG